MTPRGELIDYRTDLVRGWAVGVTREAPRHYVVWYQPPDSAPEAVATYPTERPAIAHMRRMLPKRRKGR